MKKQTIFFLLLALFISTAFVLLVPKVTSTIFPQKRAEMLQNFLDQTKTNQDMNLQSYWQLREFYFPGSFVYEKSGLAKQNPEITMFTNLDHNAIPQLLFVSAKVISVGGRTKSKQFPNIVTLPNRIILQTPSVIISK